MPLALQSEEVKQVAAMHLGIAAVLHWETCVSLGAAPGPVQEGARQPCSAAV